MRVRGLAFLAEAKTREHQANGPEADAEIKISTSQASFV